MGGWAQEGVLVQKNIEGAWRDLEALLEGSGGEAWSDPERHGELCGVRRGMEGYGGVPKP